MTDTTASFRFSRLITVVATDIDDLNHVNNVQYVQYVQDTAVAHWQAAVPVDQREQYMWVVLEHRVRYHKPAFLGEELRCTTWVGTVRGAQSQRFVRIERAADGVLLCEAETQWVLLEPATQRPKRVTPELEQRLREVV